MTIVDHVPFWFGVALLLFGWALYWIAVATAGAVLFGLAALAVGTLACDIFDVTDAMRLGIQVGSLFLGGLTGALMFRFLSRFAFFATGAIIGGAATYSMIEHLRVLGHEWAQDPFAMGVLPVVGAILIGLLFAILDDIILAAASSVVGGVLLMIGLGWPMGGLPLLAIIPIGFAIQIGLAGGKRTRKAVKGDVED